VIVGKPVTVSVTVAVLASVGVLVSTASVGVAVETGPEVYVGDGVKVTSFKVGDSVAVALSIT